VPSSVKIDQSQGTITAMLEQSSCKTVLFTSNLTLKLSFLEGGYLRTEINDPLYPRFKLDIDGIGAKKLKADSKVRFE
jgi:hypothetical protein